MSDDNEDLSQGAEDLLRLRDFRICAGVAYVAGLATVFSFPHLIHLKEEGEVVIALLASVSFAGGLGMLFCGWLLRQHPPKSREVLIVGWLMLMAVVAGTFTTSVPV